MTQKWPSLHATSTGTAAPIPREQVPPQVVAHAEQAQVNREMRRLGRWSAYVGSAGAVPLLLGVGISVTEPAEETSPVVNTTIPAGGALSTLGAAGILGAALWADRKRERRQSRHLQEEQIIAPNDTQPEYILPNGARYLPPEKEGGQWQYIIADAKAQTATTTPEERGAGR